MSDTFFAEVLNVSGLPDRYRQLLEANFRACRAYAPAPYPGRVVLIQARSQPMLRIQERDLGWRGVAAGGVDVQIVPGNHDNLIDTRQVSSVAKRYSWIACVRPARIVPSS